MNRSAQTRTFSFLFILFALASIAATAQPVGLPNDAQVLSTSALFQVTLVKPASMLDADEFGSRLYLAAPRQSFGELRATPSLWLGDFPLPTGETVTLALTRFTIFSDDARIIEASASGHRRRPVPDVALYKGMVGTDASTFAYLAVTSDEVTGSIRIGSREYSILTTRTAGTNEATICIAEVISSRQQSECGVTEVEEMQFGIAPQSLRKSLDVKKTLVDTLLAQVAIDADYETFQHYGSVAAAETYITARMGEVTAIYEHDLAVRLEIPFMRIWSDINDPYTGTSMNACLSEFTNVWRATMDTVKRTLAVLISRRPLDGQDDGVTSGLAALDALCLTSRGYAYDKFSKNNNFISGHTGVLAHEIGHVFGSRHTHSCWWSPAIDSCANAEDGTCFAGTKQTNGEIMSYCNSKTHEFRPRVAAWIRQRAEAAACMTIFSQIRNIIINGPAGGESWCAGSAQTIRWESSGVKDIKIELSSDGGASFPTLLVDATAGPAKAWLWNIPLSLAAGTRYRLRLSDSRVGTPIAVMTTNFEIKPGTAITQHPVGKTICEKNTASLTVAAAGAQPITYQWQRNGVNIPGQTNATLSIASATKADSGSYRCIVAGPCGTQTSNATELTVKAGAVITKHPPASVVACLGKPVTIAVEVTGDNVTYQWFNGTNLVANATKSSLTFANPTANDQGAYFCQVSSPCGGTMSDIAYLTIGTPGVKLNKPVGGERYYTSDSLTVQWNATCLAKVKVEFSSNGGSSWTTVLADVDAALSELKFILPSNTTDKAMVKVTDMTNGTLYSQSQNFSIAQKVNVVTPPSPSSHVLEQNFPNPFSDRTTITLRAAAGFDPTSIQSLILVDLLGRDVLDLTSAARSALQFTIEGRQLPSYGLYMLRLIYDNRVETRALLFFQ